MTVDIHTHSPNPYADISLVDISGSDCIPPQSQGILYSMGIHPCSIRKDWEEQAERIQTALKGQKITALGECGFDRLSASPPELQEKVFDTLSRISLEEHCPMIIHCVRAADLLLQYASRMPAEGAWVVHGFRGKPAAMRQLLDAGFSISFGTRFNSGSAMQCPSGRLFAETDTAAPESLGETIGKCSEIRKEQTGNIIWRNFERLLSHR